jgi:hypothetical protein
MKLTCSKCGVRDARVSHPQSILEQLKSWCGIYQLRCRRCQKRWETSVWSDGAWKYARCPRCYRQELTTWSEQYYHSPAMMTVQLRLGATPYRCAACRCNFASFKECKERFMWRHSTRVPAPGTPEAATATAEAVNDPANQPGPVEPSKEATQTNA